MNTFTEEDIEYFYNISNTSDVTVRYWHASAEDKKRGFMGHISLEIPRKSKESYLLFLSTLPTQNDIAYLPGELDGFAYVIIDNKNMFYIDKRNISIQFLESVSEEAILEICDALSDISYINIDNIHALRLTRTSLNKIREITGHCDSLYISFSTLRGNVESRGQIISNYIEDRRTLNGRRPDEIIILEDCLDVDAMIEEHQNIYKKYQQLLENPRASYYWRKCVSSEPFLNFYYYEKKQNIIDITSSNCSHYAYHLLKIGGIQHKVSDLRVGKIGRYLLQIGAIIGTTVGLVWGLQPGISEEARKICFSFGIGCLVTLIGTIIWFVAESAIRNCLGYGSFVTPEGLMKIIRNVRQTHSSRMLGELALDVENALSRQSVPSPPSEENLHTPLLT
jgi:hypothetical protein